MRGLLSAYGNSIYVNSSSVTSGEAFNRTDVKVVPIPRLGMVMKFAGIGKRHHEAPTPLKPQGYGATVAFSVLLECVKCGD
jgi:hypothetical protein